MSRRYNLEMMKEVGRQRVERARVRRLICHTCGHFSDCRRQFGKTLLTMRLGKAEKCPHNQW